MKPDANEERSRLRRSEPVVALLIVLFFCAINLLVATRTPTVNVDEPEYCDPAANLYLGSGFTSTMWGQNHGDFWCGNVPLYQAILYSSFKLAGFGLFQARAVNTILAAFGGWLIWSALRRSHLVQTPANRLLALALVLSGSVSTLTFRTIRPDTTMFFVCALVFFAGNLPRRSMERYLFAGVFSALLPAAGVPMLPYAGMLLLLHVAVYGLAELALLACIAAGIAGGLATLYLFYHHFSAWQTFLGIVLPFTGIGTASQHSGSFFHDRILGFRLGDENLFTSFFGNPFEFLDQKTLFDYSAALLFLVAVFIAAKCRRTAAAGDRKLMVFILTLALVVPPFMHVAGHYRSMYRWMTYIPLAMAAPRLMEILRAKGGTGALLRGAQGLICVSLCLGIPLRTLAVIPGWRERSMAPLEQVSAQVAKPSDVVVCDFKAYFALRPRTKLLYAYGLPARGDFGFTRDLPTNDVSLLCLAPGHVATVTQTIGGRWREVELSDDPVAAALAKTRYAVDFYRRESGTNEEAGSTKPGQ